MTKSRLAAAAFAAALTLASAACGGDSTGPSPAPAQTQGAIVMRNDANTNIVSVNISRCTNPSWGDNLLAANESIAPTALRSFPLEPACYDVRVSTASKSAYWYDRTVAPGDTVLLALSAAANEPASVRLEELPQLKTR